MNSRLCILLLGLLVVARPALAQSQGSFIWDLNVANAVDESMVAEDVCRPNPYVPYRQGCASGELNIGLARSNEHRLTTLDRLALFVYRYKDLNLNTDIRPNTKLKFTMNLMNLYQQEVRARISVRIRF